MALSVMSTSDSELKSLYKLERLSPTEIGTFWTLFEYSLWESLPPGVTPSSGFVNNVLAMCLAGDMQAWLCYFVRGETTSILGAVITSIDKDPVSGDKNLVIYSLKGFGGNPNYPWKSSMLKLLEFAKAEGCRRVIAYTGHLNVMRIAETLNCKSNIAVLEWEVE